MQTLEVAGILLQATFDHVGYSIRREGSTCDAVHLVLLVLGLNLAILDNGEQRFLTHSVSIGKDVLTIEELLEGLIGYEGAEAGRFTFMGEVGAIDRL